MVISRCTVSLFAFALAGCFQSDGGTDEVADTSTDSSTTSSETGSTGEISTSMDTTAGTEDLGGGCGDGLIAIDEECDGENLGNASCESLGYFGGVLACTDTCTLDVSGCQMESVCGNGIAEGEELCDGGDFVGETCQTIGDFVDGALTCSDTCDEIITIGCLSPGEGEMCVMSSDCSLETLYCANGTCWNGSETDPCDFGVQCEFNNCVGGMCWDGTEGDPCYDDTNCSELVPFCNPVDMSCHDGSEGDPCEASIDCSDSTPFCVESGCWEGGLGDPCYNNGQCNDLLGAPFCSDLTDTCQTGEPGSPCADLGDCVSGICDMVLMICA